MCSGATFETSRGGRDCPYPAGAPAFCARESCFCCDSTESCIGNPEVTTISEIPSKRILVLIHLLINPSQAERFWLFRHVDVWQELREAMHL